MKLFSCCTIIKLEIPIQSHPTIRFYSWLVILCFKDLRNVHSRKCSPCSYNNSSCYIRYYILCTFKQIWLHCLLFKFLWYSFIYSAFGSGFFWVMLQLALFNIFLFRISFLSNLIAFVIAIIYMGYILIDTQLILGGKNKELSLDNHILGSLILYIDIIVLFLRILQLLGSKKDWFVLNLICFSNLCVNC